MWIVDPTLLYSLTRFFTCCRFHVEQPASSFAAEQGEQLERQLMGNLKANKEIGNSKDWGRVVSDG